MATHTLRNGAYLIRVSNGYDENKKQIIESMTWYPPVGLSSKALELELANVKYTFDKEVKHGNTAVAKDTFVAETALVPDFTSAEESSSGNKRFSSANVPTFSEYAEKYITLKELSGMQHKTVLFYESLLGRLNPIIGERPLSSIKSDDIDDLLIWLGENVQNKKTGGTLSKKTIKEHIRFVSTLFNAAIIKGIVATNPTAATYMPKVTQKKANYFQPPQLNEIHDALENEPLKWKICTLLLMYTGCRRAEIMGLTWENINFKSWVITINRTVLYSAKKGVYESNTKTKNSERSLKIPFEAVTLLKEYKELQNTQKDIQGDRWKNTDYVFTQEDGSPMHPDSITSWLNDFSKRHLLFHINPHAFRHTMASILIFKGVDIAHVSAYLGHSSIRTTLNTYTHIIDEYNATKQEIVYGDIIMEQFKNN